jgi:hypothetical protein
MARFDAVHLPDWANAFLRGGVSCIWNHSIILQGKIGNLNWQNMA